MGGRACRISNATRQALRASGEWRGVEAPAKALPPAWFERARS